MTTSKTGQVRATASISSATLSHAEGPLALPMPAITATPDRTAAPVLSLSIPADTSVQVAIPVKNVSASTIAILLKADGTEELIRTASPTETALICTVADGDAIQITENVKHFSDVSDSFWGAEAVAFASSRELLQGVSSTAFAPNAAMTRAMMMTVLARLDGIDTSSGDTWYATGHDWAKAFGISDGTNLMATLTREQFAVMLYRYAGQPAVDGQ